MKLSIPETTSSLVLSQRAISWTLPPTHFLISASQLLTRLVGVTMMAFLTIGFPSKPWHKRVYSNAIDCKVFPNLQTITTLKTRLKQWNKSTVIKKKGTYELDLTGFTQKRWSIYPISSARMHPCIPAAFNSPETHSNMNWTPSLHYNVEKEIISVTEKHS